MFNWGSYRYESSGCSVHTYTKTTDGSAVPKIKPELVLNMNIVYNVMSFELENGRL